jgi:cysteine desulfurase/selenocysteine lyase
MVLAATDSKPNQRSRLQDLRADFPLLHEAELGRSLHYLDNAATTHKPQAVIDAISGCYREFYASVHRGLYPLAEEATRRYEDARDTVARFVGAPVADQLVFTRSTTESINMVAHGWARPRLSPGERIWVTRMEHHANLLPWQRICHERGAELRVIELCEDGSLDWQRAEDLFDRRTRLIALCHVSNVLGIVNPLQAICERAAMQGIPVLVDAAQSVPHLTVNANKLDCDFLAFSAHKMYGPCGIGALYAKPQRLEEMEPLLVGGGMVDEVTMDASSWAEYPTRFEAGSPNLADAVGFAAAVDYMEQLGRDGIHDQVSTLTRRALDALAEVRGLTLLAQPGVDRSGIISFTLDGVHPHDVAQIAGEQGVALRAGHHCCQPLLQHLGLAATVRASFAVYNSEADIDALLAAIDQAQQVFG